MKSRILIITKHEVEFQYFQKILPSNVFEPVYITELAEAQNLIFSDRFDAVIIQRRLTRQTREFIQSIRNKTSVIPLLYFYQWASKKRLKSLLDQGFYKLIPMQQLPEIIIHEIEQAVEFKNLKKDIHQIAKMGLNAGILSSELKYKNLFDNAIDAMFIFDETLCIKEINQATIDLLGYEEKELLDRSLYSIMLTDISTEDLIDKNVVIKEITCVKKDGIQIIIELHLKSVSNENNLHQYYHGIAHDITQNRLNEQIIQNQNEELSKANKSLKIANKIQEDILNLVSHELRTPLTIISGNVEIIKEFYQTLSPKDIEESINKISAQVVHQSKIIDQLLMASKMLNNEIIPDKMNVDLVSIIAMAYETKIYEFYNKQISFRIEKPEEDIIAYVDESQISLALMCLLENALKFTNTGGSVTLSIRKDNIHGIISVIDSGIGIPTEHQQAIFESFFQIETSTTRRYGGIGLGLAIAKRLLDLNGCRINVESKLNEGSVFSIIIPLTVEDYQETVKSMPMKLVENKRKSVLIVDDFLDVVNVVKFNLAYHNYEVFDASNGQQALDILSGHDIDLVILDLMMPDMDGFEVCKRIKAEHRTNHIPVVILTSQARDQERLKAIELGASDYIVKPFKQKQLINVINNLI